MKLRQARVSAEKSQQMVATEAGMSINGYRKLEAGGVRRPAATTIHGVSRSLGVDPHEVDEFREVLAGYEVVSGTQVAHQTAALAQPPVVIPGVEETHSYRDAHGEELRGVLRSVYGVEVPTQEEAKRVSEEVTLRPDRALFEAIEALIEREVDRRMATRTAAQQR